MYQYNTDCVNYNQVTCLFLKQGKRKEKENHSLKGRFTKHDCSYYNRAAWFEKATLG